MHSADGPGVPGTPAAHGPAVAHSTVFALRCTAHPEHVRTLRAGIVQWLTGLRWPEDDRDDVVLAASEAFENAVDHAYRPGTAGVVDVLGRVEAVGPTRRVILRIADRGRWRPPPAEPGHRGRGLKVIRECVDQLRIDSGPLGTVAKLTSCGVPLLDATTVSPLPAPPRHGQPAPVVAVPAVDHAQDEHRRRQGEIMLATERLRANAQSLGAGAAAAWLRAQDVMQASSRLCTNARNIRSRRPGTGDAA